MADRLPDCIPYTLIMYYDDYNYSGNKDAETIETEDDMSQMST